VSKRRIANKTVIDALRKGLHSKAGWDQVDTHRSSIEDRKFDRPNGRLWAPVNDQYNVLE